MSNTALLHMQAINKSYLFGKTEEIKVLDTINLELHRGEFVALVGPSGSGKTTLLNLIGCIDHSDSGEIYLDGKALHNQSEQFLKNIRRNRIGFIFQ
ncbi:MAG: ATP-binding cassette domain-containing protein, partial [Gammaproteobacteria bacterium]|nr:ATP-binding cassette domain-containing protein [Gammaproteobacteria bacterium]